MRNLIIDIGNTNTKFGIFENNQLKKQGVISEISALQQLVAEEKPENIALASVGISGEEVLKTLSVPGKKVELTHKTKLPITNLYQTPETLGKDRLAAVLGAAHLFPKTDCLVIDAGTCITYDFLDAEGNYHGGLIAPGLAMKFKAMHTFTSRLPFLEQPAFVPEISGKTTAQAMQSGVYNGTLAEAEGIIKRYEKQAQNLHIILCGGDATFFETNLKGRIFAIPELVLLGLNSLLIPHA
ncbi:type III pantothenate kinase [Adhaeribacter sp. BT258]|uniref:Type III pantothenate kinase n=1 Tax=Adhaeribacter terrigena TaxID=2793070 RepID=A0ABS1C2B4_9BACT|nr:type III pantothenate kinase [Adhaeribacter terrigena]MBK0403543.1 type III pantothenate kinase [Adhaeribacter terrigena]